MTIANLKLTIEKLRAKLADPRDSDDKKWVDRWLKRCERQLSKKEKSVERKLERAERRRRQSEAIPHLGEL